MDRNEYNIISAILEEAEEAKIELSADQHRRLKKVVVSWAARQGMGPDTDFDALVDAVRLGISLDPNALANDVGRGPDGKRGAKGH